MKYERQKIIRPLTCGVLCLLFFLATGSFSSVKAAATYTFSRITSNTPDGYELPEIEMTVDEGPFVGSVLFTFELTGPGCVTEIYFEDGTLLDVSQIIDSPTDVDFYSYDDPENSNGINPGNLPGGNELDVPFNATEALSVEAAGNTSTGICDGETLGIVYLLQGGQDYDDVLDALHLGFDDPEEAGSLRVGLHVRGLGPDGEYSDSFIAVPVPGALVLAGLGTILVGALRRRKNT